jgi:hypothetical protein
MMGKSRFFCDGVSLLNGAGCVLEKGHECPHLFSVFRNEHFLMEVDDNGES